MATASEPTSSASSSKPTGPSHPATSAKHDPTHAQPAGLNVHAVKNMFAEPHHRKVEEGYKHVENALADYIKNKKVSLTSEQLQTLRLYIYATIRTETGNFTPRDEPPNRTNTSKLPYEYQNPNDMVLYSNYNKYAFKNGNRSEHDGEIYHGRGYVQITGKNNYSYYGASAGIPDLVQNPSKASDPRNAAKLLVAYIMEHRNRTSILKALNKGEMREARAVVNGPGKRVHRSDPPNPNGMRDFKRAYTQGLEAIDPGLRDRARDALLNDPNRT